MTEQELKQIWRESNIAQEKINIQSPKLLSMMDQELKRFEQRINRRDRREIGIFIFSIFYLSYFGYSVSEPLKKIGAALLILYALFVIYYLIRARGAKPIFSVTQSLREQLMNYRIYILKQQQLIKNVLYWYLLPLLPGLILLLISEKLLVIMITSAAIFLMFYWIYQMNQRAAVENYNPLLKQINIAIKKLEE